jgi:hypothetical protein
MERTARKALAVIGRGVRSDSMDEKLTQQHYTRMAIILFAISWAWIIACVVNASFNPVWAIGGFGTGLYFMVQRNYMLLTGR